MIEYLKNIKSKYWLVCIPLLLFIVSNFGIGFNGLYGQDSHAYFQYANLLKTVNFNYSEAGFLYWPKMFSTIAALLSYLGISVLTAFQLISISSLIFSLLIANKIIKLLFNKSGHLFLLLGGALSVYFSRGGIILMSDMFATLLVITTFYFYYINRSSPNNFKLFGTLLFAFLAVLSRYACLPIVVAPVIATLLQGFLNLKNLQRVLVLILSIGSMIFLLQFNDRFFDLGKEMLGQWSFSNVFLRETHNENGTNFHTVPNVLYVLGNFAHFGYLSFGVLLLPFYKKLKGIDKTMLISLMIYLGFLSGLPTQNYRFLMLSHLLVLILLFPAFEALLLFLKEKRVKVLFIVGTILFNLTFYMYSFGKTFNVYKVEKEVVEEIKSLKSDQPIYSFYVDQSFKSYGLENETRNFYYKEFASFEKGALVVFNPEKFKEQWEGTNVMNNWNILIDNYQLDTIKVLTCNWGIYRIK